MRVGLDIGGTKTDAVLLGEDAAVRARVRVPTAFGPDGVTATVHEVIGRLLTVAEIGRRDVSSVGIGIPGQVAPGGTVVRNALNLGLAEFDVARAVAGLVPAAVTLENDVKAAAAGAAALLPDVGDLAFLNLGTGVAAGIVIGGRLWRGRSGTAGEIGHVCVDPAGPRCRCGARGCIEAYAGGGALAERWGAVRGGGVGAGAGAAGTAGAGAAGTAGAGGAVTGSAGGAGVSGAGAAGADTGADGAVASGADVAGADTGGAERGGAVASGGGPAAGGAVAGSAGGGPAASARYPVAALFDAADAGDALAVALRDELVVAVAQAVRLLVLTADVEAVVVGGGLTALGDRLLAPIRATLDAQVIDSPFLGSLGLSGRIRVLPPDALPAALGAAILGGAPIQQEVPSHG